MKIFNRKKKKEYNWFISFSYKNGMVIEFGHCHMVTDYDILANGENINKATQLIENYTNYYNDLVILNIIRLGENK